MEDPRKKIAQVKRFILFAKILIVAMIMLVVWVLLQGDLSRCIPASSIFDTQSSTVYVPAHVDAEKRSVCMEKDQHGFDSCIKLSWIDTSIMTNGKAVIGSEGVSFDDWMQDDLFRDRLLTFEISDLWYPFGKTEHFEYKHCKMLTCDPENDLGCLPFASPSDTRMVGSVTDECQPQNSDGRGVGGVMIGTEHTDLPCYLGCGWGLYGIIAIDDPVTNTSPGNPNIDNIFDPNRFRMFRIGPAYRDNLVEDENTLIYRIPYTQSCIGSSENCTPDTDLENNKIVKRGRLYLKILDNYYDDNAGGYSVTIHNADFIPPASGWFSNLYTMIKNTLYAAAEGIAASVVQNSKFINIVQSLITLYMVLFAIMFISGMIEMKIGDMVMRLIKLAIVLTIISPRGLESINFYIFNLFIDGAEDLGSILLKTSLENSSLFTHDGRRIVLPINASPFTLIDSVFDFIFSKSTWIKIVAMLYSAEFMLFVPMLAVSIMFLIEGLIKSAVIYISSMLIVAILLAVSPLFFAFMLFKVTKEMFDSWLRLMVSNSLMFVMVSAVLILFISVVVGQIEKMFYFQVCPGTIFNIEIFKVMGFKIPNTEQAKQVLNLETFIFFLIMVLTMKAFMEQMPSLVDALTNTTGFSPLRDFFQGAQQSFANMKQEIKNVPIPLTGGKTIGQAFSQAKSAVFKRINPINLAAAGVLNSPLMQKMSRKLDGKKMRHIAKAGRLAWKWSHISDIKGFADSIGGAQKTIASVEGLSKTRQMIGKATDFSAKYMKKGAIAVAMGPAALAAAGAPAVAVAANSEPVKKVRAKVAGVGKAAGIKVARAIYNRIRRPREPVAPVPRVGAGPGRGLGPGLGGGLGAEPDDDQQEPPANP